MRPAYPADSASAASPASLRPVAEEADDAQVLHLTGAAWSLPVAHRDHVMTLALAVQRVAAGLTLPPAMTRRRARLRAYSGSR